MHYVYVLQSEADGWVYVGYSSDLKRRFAEHNAKQNASTRHKAPFQLVYYEAYKSRADAVRREKSLKRHARAYQELKHRIAGSL